MLPEHCAQRLDCVPSFCNVPLTSTGNLCVAASAPLAQRLSFRYIPAEQRARPPRSPGGIVTVTRAVRAKFWFAWALTARSWSRVAILGVLEIVVQDIWARPAEIVVAMLELVPAPILQALFAAVRAVSKALLARHIIGRRLIGLIPIARGYIFHDKLSNVTVRSVVPLHCATA